MSKPTNLRVSLRDEMPEVTAFIDDLRAVFGADAINPQIKKGMAGLPGFFHAKENGHEVGTPAPPARHEFTVDQLVLESINPLNPKAHADRNRRR